MKLRSKLGLLRLASFVSLFPLAACSAVTLDTGAPGSTQPASDDEVVDESVVAGANQNDRSIGKDGEELLTGAMVVSPGGRYVVMQRNTLTLVFDAVTRAYREVEVPLLRVAFAKRSDVAFAVTASGELQALDLASLSVRWRLPVSGCTLLRLGPADDALLVGDGASVRVVDAARGEVRSTVAGLGGVVHASFVPGQGRAILVAPTAWRDGGPHTPVVSVDLGTRGETGRADVPNCAAPASVLPDGSRAFLSPTYCSPGSRAPAGEAWTNPDPVSVIELGSGQIAFRKNLPGFGPVAMSPDGSRVVAYLDVKRMDAAMFEDPKQVPWTEGPRYHLMTIDPGTLGFRLAPVGNAIPRFAMAADGRTLLVDASTKATSRTKLAARATASIGPDGISATVETNLDVFGSAAAFGGFDLATQTFAAFRGPVAPLDRFVQLGGGRFVLTLAKRADGLGGTPFMIDLQTKATWQLQGDFGSGVRDVGLDATGTTALVRLRLPANVHDGGFYSREGLCLSTDGTCGAGLHASYEATVPFATVPPQPDPKAPADECPGGHDCF